MKVVHLNTIDQGGSYKAAKRIHEGMIQAGAQSCLILRSKVNPENEGLEIIDNPIKKLISKTKNVGNLVASSGEVIMDLFGTDVTRIKEVREADAIILHWCNSFIGYKQYKGLARLGKPVVLVAHDMWPCTGGCHLDGYCGRFENGCISCPIIEKSNKPIMRKSLPNRGFLKKKEAFKGIAYVGVSSWSLENAKRSPIWTDNSKTCILNPVDYEIFRHYSETKYDHLRDNPEQKIILYGAVKTFSETNKGSLDFEKVLEELQANDYKVVVFGNKPGESLRSSRFPVEYLGYINSESDMAQLYSFADVYVNTSHQESFCYTVAEALACKTPVVAFGVGGIVDQIKPNVNGYLAPLGDIDEMASGIEYCLSNEMESVNLHNSLLETGKKYIEFIESLGDSLNKRN